MDCYSFKANQILPIIGGVSTQFALIMDVCFYFAMCATSDIEVL